MSARTIVFCPIRLIAERTLLNWFFVGVTPPPLTTLTSSIITEFSHSAGRIVAGVLVAGLPSVKKPAVPAAVDAGCVVAAVELSI
ncbi:MAG TPA: hypothetical protein DC084_28465 [Cupriavidus sp.]|nr:hypothetical protein [Cupriavidus sp.]HBO79552.1 hypothetical protein [Cupriavidus sp.]